MTFVTEVSQTKGCMVTMIDNFDVKRVVYLSLLEKAIDYSK